MSVAYKIALQVRDPVRAELMLREIAESIGPEYPDEYAEYMEAAELVRRAKGQEAAERLDRLIALRTRQMPMPERAAS